ncbi:unnamed protein product [Vitrella brassicaformis CCMP3155]|uniref:C3H1-type domain-containing protein n=3 Tax=Vitrella brassicaformis TaxID=1169539 RepID=A0A0G4H0E8_VITBC|nr:unnamed protein product [Vitrella brassicaformis CCMP3155]|eukprot:CEM36797.1 unnamed protein product [Vitrella brassicaformis CCMP3155]
MCWSNTDSIPLPKQEPFRPLFVSVKGQICHKRTVSRSLCFIDIAEPTSSGRPPPSPSSPSPAAQSGASHPPLIGLAFNAQYLRPQDDVDGSSDQHEATSFTTTVTSSVHVAVYKALKLGDVIAAWGFPEQNRSPRNFTLRVHGYRVLRQWGGSDGDFQCLVNQYLKTHHEMFTAGAAAAAAEAANGGDVCINGEGDAAAVDISRLCKFFTTSGVCYRSNCQDLHVADPHVRAKWESMMTHRRTEASRLADDPHPTDGKLPETKRAALFCDWLVSIYGVDYLSSGSGVIDVAGGRGEVAFELTVIRGIPATVIDPRPMKLNKAQFRWLASERSMTRMQSVAFLHGSIPQIRDILDESFFGRADPSETPSRLSLFERCSVIVGMHPDEATGILVDMAVRFGKPFAVLPCCVFGHLFPERTITVTAGEGEGGAARQSQERPVKTYDDLCEWIRQRDTQLRVERAFINTRGKNQILYTRRGGTERAAE